MRTAQSYKKDFATFTGNSSSSAPSTASYDNLTWGMRMINDSIRYLATVFYFNEVTYIVPGGTVATQQGYTLPGDFESLLNVTVLIGGILYQPIESPDRRKFDLLNTVPFNNDFPQFYYIYNGQILLWPTPASNSNVITLHYKKRITDIVMDDVTDVTSSKTVSVTNGDATVTASGSVFKKWMGSSGWIQIPYSSTDASNGDNKWYQIDTITSDTSLELKNNYNGASATGAAFTIGDVPILPEDYQDLPLYRACHLYYTIRIPDPAFADRSANFKAMYNEGYTALNAKYASKSTSPVLTDMDYPVYNPNLFPNNLSQI